MCILSRGSTWVQCYKIKYYTTTGRSFKKKQVLRGNKYFTLNNYANQCRTLYIKSWVTAGIITVGDLAYKDGLFNEEYLENRLHRRSK